jgi:hypothetical protein
MGASKNTGSDPVATACGSNSDCNRDLVVHYRALAVDRMRMAEKYAREADCQALELGQDSPKVRMSRALAQKAWTEAQEATFLARQYEIQFPPKEEMSSSREKREGDLLRHPA